MFAIEPSRHSLQSMHRWSPFGKLRSCSIGFQGVAPTCLGCGCLSLHCGCFAARWHITCFYFEPNDTYIIPSVPTSNKTQQRPSTTTDYLYTGNIYIAPPLIAYVTGMHYGEDNFSASGYKTSRRVSDNFKTKLTSLQLKKKVDWM